VIRLEPDKEYPVTDILHLLRGRADEATSASRKEARGPCPFCAELKFGEHVVAGYGTVVAIADRAPVAEGHLLIVPRRHTEDLFSMTAEEHADAMTLAGMLRARALAAAPAITGFNVGANCGASAGQKVMHAHIHFIPRRCETPIKGAIRNKMAY
jgi:diadenosine tetraphosphate (Ap4A) HIT family hydrolase